MVTAMAVLSAGCPAAFAEEETASAFPQEREEHVCTPECYERILICGQEEREPVTEIRREFVSGFHPHHHSGGCYTDGELTCGYAENVYYHTHNEFCLDENGNTVCGLEESKPHRHTDECYETVQVLICGKEETEGHVHQEACYAEDGTLICTETEREAHRHGEECYETEKRLICSKPVSTHRHSEACYRAGENGEKKQLICGKTEVPVFTSGAENWIETETVIDPGHHHEEECWKLSETPVCGKTDASSGKSGSLTDNAAPAENLPEATAEEAEPEEPREASGEEPEQDHPEENKPEAPAQESGEEAESPEQESPEEEPQAPAEEPAEASGEETETPEPENPEEPAAEAAGTPTEEPGEETLAPAWETAEEPGEKPEGSETENPEEPAAEETETPAEESAEETGEEPEAPETENPEEPAAEEAGPPAEEPAEEPQAPAEEPTEESGDEAEAPESENPEEPAAEEAETPAEEPAEEPQTPAGEPAAEESGEEPEGSETENPEGPAAEEPEAPAEEPAEEPQAPTKEPAEESGEEPEVPEPEKPEEPTAEEPEAPAEEPAEASKTPEEPQAPAEESGEEPEGSETEKPEEPAAEAAETPAEEPAEEPQAPAEEPAEESGNEPEEELTEEPASEDDQEPHIFETEVIGEDGQVYRITVKTGPCSGIPAKAVLSVRLIRKGSPEYEAVLGKAGETLQDGQKMEEFFAFDICLVDPENPEKHYQPVDESAVSVSITVPDLKPTEQDSEMQVLHFTDNRPGEPEILHTESIPEGEEPREVSFSTGSFSTFVLMTTTAAEGKIAVACEGVSGDTECTLLTADTETIGTTGQETWFSFEDSLSFSKRPEIQGTVNLVLRDGKTLTAPKGINLLDGSKLVIRQEQGSNGGAILNAVITDTTVTDSAGIGGDGAHQKAGSLEIYGGTITSQGASFAAGIGGGNGGYSGAITIRGGTVNATGGHSAAGIGGGVAGSMSGTLTILGGTVNASGGDYGAGIGGGQYFSDDVQLEKLVGGNGGNVVISGGNVTAKGGLGASGIGGGDAGSGGTLSINGAAVVAASCGDAEGDAAAGPEAIGRGDSTIRNSGSEISSGKIAFSGSTKVYTSCSADPEKDKPVAQEQRTEACRAREVKIVSSADAEEYNIDATLTHSATGTEEDEKILVLNDAGEAISAAAAGIVFTVQVTCRKQTPEISCQVTAVYTEKDKEKNLTLSGPEETEKDGIRTLTYTGTMPEAELTITATLTRNQKSITIDNYDQTVGTVTVTPEKTAPGERPILTFTANEGYSEYWLKTLKVTGASSQTVYAEIKETGMPEHITNTDGNGHDWQFEMPDEDVILTGITFGRGTYYIDRSGVRTPRRQCFEVTGDMTEWNDSGAEDGWYVVRGEVTMNGTLHICREVNLVLSDGAKMIAPTGIVVDAGMGGALYVWAQEKGTGCLEATGNDRAAGIGATKKIESGPIRIFGGQISAWGQTDSAGIGGAYQSYVKGDGITIGVPAGFPDTFTTVNAWGGENGSGIGEGNGHDGGGVTITGGTINAWGGEDGAGIGAGQDNDLFRPIVITGGNIHAYGGKNAAGIGLGPRYADHGGNMRNTIEISGKNTYVYAEGGSEDGAGIGTGERGNMEGTITIREATVEAVAHDGAAGIGSGYKGSTEKGTITIESGNITVRVTEGNGAGIGSGEKDDCGAISIQGGVIQIYTDGKGGSLGGSKGEGNGTLDLNPHTLVSAGSDGNYVSAGDRTGTCWSGDVHYLKIEPCTHPGGTIVPVDHVNHVITCQWCGFNNEPEEHSYGNDRSQESFYRCSCGYSRKRLVTGTADREGFGSVTAGLSPDSIKEQKLETIPGETVYVHLEPSAGTRIVGISGSYCAEGDTEPRAFNEFSALPADTGKNYQFAMPDPDDDRPELKLTMETQGGESAPIPDLAEYGVTYLSVKTAAGEEYLIAQTEEEAAQKEKEPGNWVSSDEKVLDFEGLEPGKIYLIYARDKAVGEVTAGPKSKPLRATTDLELDSLQLFRRDDLSVGQAITALPIPFPAGKLAFQWYRDEEALSKYTSGSYVLTKADINHTLKIQVTQIIDKKGNVKTAEQTVKFSPEGSVWLVYQRADGSWEKADTIPAEQKTQGKYTLDEAGLRNYVPEGTTGEGFRPVAYSFGYQEKESERTAIPKNKEILISESDAQLYVYFERNMYALNFYNSMEGKGTPAAFSVRYGAPLNEFSGKTVQQFGSTFAGWSRNPKPEGTEYGYMTSPSGGGEKPNFVLFDLNSATMPASGMNLYPVLIKPRVEVRLDPGAADANGTRQNMNGWQNPVVYTDQTTKAYLDGGQARCFTIVSGDPLPADALKRMAEVTRDGYEPAGWYSASGIQWKDKLNVLPIFCDTTKPEKREGTSNLYYTLTLKARWKLRNAMLHYDVQGQSWKGEDLKDIQPGTEMKISDETVMSPEGKVFLGWKDQKGNFHSAGSSIRYEDLELVSTIGTGKNPNVITLEAVFFEHQHMVAFDSRGGSFTEPILLSEEDFEAGKRTVSLEGKTPERKGGTFLGWALSPDADETETVTEVSFEDGSAVKWVYALWKNKDYSIYFSGNGGTVDGKAILRRQYTYGEQIKKDETPVPVRTHYTFAGWKPELPAFMQAKILYVSAVWEPVNHTWTFDPADGSEIRTITACYGEPVQRPADPVREGYVFIGWKSEGKYAGVPEYMDEDRNWTAGWNALRSAPEAPEVSYVTALTVEVQARPGEEYALVYAEEGNLPEEKDWKLPAEDGTMVFYPCKADTSYLVYARYSQTAGFEASGPSEAAQATTKRLFPMPPLVIAGFHTILIIPFEEAYEHIVEYSIDKGETWLGGQVIANLQACAVYMLTARWKDLPDQEQYPESAETEVMTDTAITETTITGIPRIGEVLTASVVPLNAERVTWQWFREGDTPGEKIPIENATESTYTVTEEDTGKRLWVVALQQSRLPELEEPVEVSAVTEPVPEPGTVSFRVSSPGEEPVPDIKLTGITEEMILAAAGEEAKTRRMNGEDLLLTVTVNDLSGRISAEEQNQMIRTLKKEALDAAVLQYFELTAELKTGEDDPIQVTNLPGDRIQVMLTVPRKHYVSGNISRTFYIAGLRGGTAEILAKEKYVVLRFETDALLSRYALGCHDIVYRPQKPEGGESDPGESDPGESEPAEATPAEATPAEATPAEVIPAEAIPAEAIPAETTPAEAIPAGATPVKATPAEAIPAEATPEEAIPEQALPTETAPQKPRRKNCIAGMRTFALSCSRRQLRKQSGNVRKNTGI